ncbi:UNVERIFIED_CONTAM: hypothetical protein HDU68_002821 [Siphonaria sp. JEL0065]|nr:hypothetical protein HDU68_002821 [Siphonaria sp. JEL0065]
MLPRRPSVSALSQASSVAIAPIVHIPPSDAFEDAEENDENPLAPTASTPVSAELNTYHSLSIVVAEGTVEEAPVVQIELVDIIELSNQSLEPASFEDADDYKSSIQEPISLSVVAVVPETINDLPIETETRIPSTLATIPEEPLIPLTNEASVLAVVNDAADVQRLWREQEQSTPSSSTPPPTSIVSPRKINSTQSSPSLRDAFEQQAVGRQNQQQQQEQPPASQREYIRSHLRTVASVPQLRITPEIQPLAHKQSHQSLKLAATKQRAEAAKASATSWIGGIFDKVLEFVDPGYQELEPHYQKPTPIRSNKPNSSTNHYNTSIQDSTSIPEMHYTQALHHLSDGDLILAISEFTLAATLGPDPHPESLRNLITLHSDPGTSVYDPIKALEWTNLRLLVLGTPEGMLAQARFLRSGKGLFGDLESPLDDADARRWRMNVQEDMEAALLVRQAADSGYPPAMHAYAVYLKENGKGKESMVWFSKAFEKGVFESAKWILHAYEKGIKGEMEPDLEMAVVWRKKVDDVEGELMKEAEEKEREEREELERYKEEADYLAFKTHKREEAWKRQEVEARARRDMDGSFTSVLKYLDWGYHMLAGA